ncbi:hypothetical protein K466DRAFT_601460 [Polyporus arcularius HHB13444]|uniref:DUF6533 domain-containing protein n=1 Tax=Polyporus arcularius HHB13444 TaxID=1314778 RepID=A0A5C3P6I9_9APHY|nr:hypothetical protein K466DRAFT_601460 [Polyporus arcularius HHB13444]
MSSETDAAAATVSLFDSLYTEYYCGVATSVLFIYDTFLTFNLEVTYFWTTKRISGASLLFFANKWISMMVSVMGLVDFASFPSDKVRSLSLSHGKSDYNQSCSWFSIASHAMGILQFIPGAAFSALRAYVLSRSKPLGIVVAALSLAPVGGNLVDYGYQYSGENFPLFGCVATDNITAALQLRFGSFSLIPYIGTNSVQGVVVIISRVPLIAADIILIYITWTTLRGSAALKDIHKSKRLTLSDILFRGGIIYFIILFFMNILHLALSATAVAEDGTSDFSLITIFTAPITAILISHFLLKLQEANHMVIKLDADDPLHSSRNPWDNTPSFILSLGGFINPSRSEQSNDDGGIELQVRSPSEAPGEEEGEVPAEVPEAIVSSSCTV